MNKPDIQAEMMTGQDGPEGKLKLIAFRFEVFDLPALDGEEDELEDAGEIMTAAVNNVGSIFQKFANRRVPDDFPTQEEVDTLNVDLAKMADRLADAIAKLTNAAWWISHEERINDTDVYEFIVDAADRA
ncbi:MAG: hypothetical protein M9924_21565 [Rhizobiaceae bacterium]|nr:hypothetical protein [Rhizobiaceae bacterium]